MDSDGNGIGDVKGEHSNQVSHCSIPVTRVFFQSGIIAKLDHLEDANKIRRAVVESNLRIATG
jgi:hypothetical protein